MTTALAPRGHICRPVRLAGLGGVSAGISWCPSDSHLLEPAISADLYLGGTPSKDGPTVYLNTHGDIDGMLARAVEAGGEIIRPKAFMGPMVGWIATFVDSEGNGIGLQQPGDGTESA